MYLVYPKIDTTNIDTNLSSKTILWLAEQYELIGASKAWINFFKFSKTYPLVIQVVEHDLAIFKTWWFSSLQLLWTFTRTKCSDIKSEARFSDRLSNRKKKNSWTHPPSESSIVLRSWILMLFPWSHLTVPTWDPSIRIPSLWVPSLGSAKTADLCG